MTLGVIFLVLAGITCTLWARTNAESYQLNLWRLYLAALSVSGVAHIFAPWLLAFVATFAVFAAIACAHVYRHDRWDEPQYRNRTLLFAAGLSLLAAISGPSLTGLAIILLGLYFTYLPHGQRQWDKVCEKTGIRF